MSSSTKKKTWNFQDFKVGRHNFQSVTSNLTWALELLILKHKRKTVGPESRFMGPIYNWVDIDEEFNFTKWKT